MARDLSHKAVDKLGRDDAEQELERLAAEIRQVEPIRIWGLAIRVRERRRGQGGYLS